MLLLLPLPLLMLLLLVQLEKEDDRDLDLVLDVALTDDTVVASEVVSVLLVLALLLWRW